MPSTKTSWYGSYGAFHDAQDNNRPALSGASNNEPGIAVLNRSTLGGYYRLRIKDAKGRERFMTVRQTDIGPAGWTGKKVDINARLASDLGYSPRDFPSNTQVIGYSYLGKKKPSEKPVRKAVSVPAAPVSSARRGVLLNYLAQRGRPGALADLGKNLG